MGPARCDGFLPFWGQRPARPTSRLVAMGYLKTKKTPHEAAAKRRKCWAPGVYLELSKINVEPLRALPCLQYYVIPATHQQDTKTKRKETK